jgi:hypothetical protein
LVTPPIKKRKRAIKNTDNTTKTTLTYYLEDGSVDEIRHYEDPIEEELFDILKLTNNELQMRYFFNDIEFAKSCPT